MQNIIFNKNKQLQNIVQERQNKKKKTLTEWMEINKINNEARKLTYIEFPMKWVWKQKDKILDTTMKWAYYRIFHIPLSSGELFY